MQLNPYFIFNGNCEEALNFYAQALGGEILHLMRFGDAPGDSQASGDKNMVMHATFKAGDIMIMASDSGNHPVKDTGSGQVFLNINCDDAGSQDKMYNALCEGGKVLMPLNDTFWGARFGMVSDKYGINWMLNLEKK